MQTIIISIYNSLHMTTPEKLSVKNPNYSHRRVKKRVIVIPNQNSNSRANRSQIIDFVSYPNLSRTLLYKLRGRELGRPLGNNIEKKWMKPNIESHICKNEKELNEAVQSAKPGDYIYFNFGTIDEIVYQVVDNNGITKIRTIRDLMHGIENPVLDFPYRIYNRNRGRNRGRSRNRSRSRSPRPNRTIGGRRRSTRKMKHRH